MSNCISSTLTILIFFTVLRKRQFGVPSYVCAIWLLIFIWATILIALLGHELAFPIMESNDLSLQQSKTSYRKSRYPIRGAVANMYKGEDLEAIVLAVKDLVYTVSDMPNLVSGGSERREWVKGFRSAFAFTSDVLRIDVITAKYFMYMQRPILILEPNPVQHIGFISTEPLRRAPFTAMTSTFDDVFTY